MNANGLDKKIKDRTASIGIVGLGNTGLPLAVAFAERGFPVTGIDTDREKIRKLDGGESYHLDIEPDTIRRIIDGGKFTLSKNGIIPDGLDCIVISVPTPLNKTRDPDISYILDVIDDVADILRPACSSSCRARRIRERRASLLCRGSKKMD